MRKLAIAVLLAASAVYGLAPDQILLLQDPAGWRYQSISDVDNGFPTKHVCFDGGGQGACTGTLHLSADHTFSEDITAHGKTLHRKGKYELAGDSLMFFDEFNNKDGPYSIVLDVTSGKLTLETVQAGVTIRMVLLSAKRSSK